MLNVNINPKVLAWARIEAGFKEDEIAKSLKVSAAKIESWETTGQNIPFTKLRLLSTKYKRQIAVFFLNDVPDKTKKPRDFRNLKAEKTALSKSTLLAMRRVKRYQETAVDLEPIELWRKRYEWQKELEDIPLKFRAEWLRSKLGITIYDQFKFQNSNEALKCWRSRIEERLGILVLQFSMPFNEVQGFCYIDELPYCIVINSKHSASGRIFGLFHEIAHVFQHQSGICLPENATINQKTEIECNEFSANFLLPKATLIASSDLKEINSYSSKFKVSSEVYLRRLLSLDLITKNEFFKLLADLKSNSVIKKGFANISPVQKSKNSRGTAFFNLVNDAINSNKISVSTGSDLLGLKVKNLLS